MTSLDARFPVKRILDGTLQKLTRCEIQVYLVVAAFKNYNTNESWTSYKTIRKYVAETNGVRINEAIERLEELALIETWTEPRKSLFPGRSKGYTRRKYKVLD
jgi:hypothetical protein